MIFKKEEMARVISITFIVFIVALAIIGGFFYLQIKDMERRLATCMDPTLSSDDLSNSSMAKFYKEQIGQIIDYYENGIEDPNTIMLIESYKEKN